MDLETGVLRDENLNADIQYANKAVSVVVQEDESVK